MKKIQLCLLVFIGFQAMTYAQTCTEIPPETVLNIQDLNAQIDLMEANSATESRTVILADFTLIGPKVYNSSATAILNRDIDIAGPCKSVIKASNPKNVYLKGDVSWRFNNSKNVTIDGFVFRRTEEAGNNVGLIELGSLSDAITIKNSVLMEYESDKPDDNYSFLKVTKGTNHVIDSCIFQNKYSRGNYVLLSESNNFKILNSIFRENDTFLFSGLSLDQDGVPYREDAKRYIFSDDSENLEIKGSSFSNKYSYWAYVQLNKGKDNKIENNTFYETMDIDNVINNSAKKDYIKIINETSLDILDNNFVRKFSESNMINYSPTVDATTGFIPNTIDGEISGNYFGKKFQEVNKESSMIKLGNCGAGTDGSHALNILIKNNEFVDYNYQDENGAYYEVISNKSSGNTYEGNIFINCNGGLFLRCGNNITVFKNKFLGDNTGIKSGITVSGTDHKIYNNYFRDLTFPILNINGGDLDGNYTRVENLEFIFNTIVNCDVNIKFNKDVSINPDDGDGIFVMAKMNSIENNIFFNDQNRTSLRLVWMDADYLGNPNPLDEINEFSTNSFKNNVFYKNTSNVLTTIITSNWTLPDENTLIHVNPELAYDSLNEIHTLTASSPNTIVNGAHDTAYYSAYISNDILDTPRGTVYDIGCHEFGGANISANKTTGLGVNTKNKALVSYPNPVKDIFTIKGVAKNTAYTIYSIAGVKVQAGNILKNDTIDVSSLSKGMYVLELEGAKTIKLIKN